MNIVFCGTPDAAVPSLRALHALGYRIPLVICQPDRPVGRHGTPQPSPVKMAAIELGLDVFQPEDLNAPEALARLRAAAPDLLVAVAYGQFLKKPLRETPRLGAINLHFSLLPKGRGAAPIARAILAGETTTGISIFRIVAPMDAGPLFATAACPIRIDDTAATLEARLAEMGAGLLPVVVAQIDAGHAVEQPQCDGVATLAPKLAKEEAAIPWSRSALEIHNRIRALATWPIAQSYALATNGDKPVRVLIHASRLVGREEVNPSWPPVAVPGMILDIVDDAIIVACGDAPLALTRIQPESRKPVTAPEFARGHHLEPGDGFGPPGWLLSMRKLAADLAAIQTDVSEFDLKRLAAVAHRLESEDGWQALERIFSPPVMPGQDPAWRTHDSPQPLLREAARIRPEIAALIACMTPEEAKDPHLLEQESVQKRLAGATGASEEFVRQCVKMWHEANHRWQAEGAKSLFKNS